MSTAERRFVVDVVCAVRTPIGPDSDCALHCCGNDRWPQDDRSGAQVGDRETGR